MVQQNNDKAFIQTAEGEIPSSKVLKIGEIEFVGADTGGARARKFTLTYGMEGIALTVDFTDDNHLARGRLEKIRDDVKAKVR